MQTSYADPAAGRPGLIVKRDDADTLVNGESGTTAIPWGRAVQVVSGTAKLLDGADDVIVGVLGFQHDHDRLHGLSSSADGPLPGQPMTIVRDGVVWVPVEAAVIYGDRPFVRYAVDGGNTKIGAFKPSSGTGLRSMQNQGQFVGPSVTYDGALVAPLELLMTAQPAATDPPISSDTPVAIDGTAAAGSTGEASDAGHKHAVAADAITAAMVGGAGFAAGPTEFDHAGAGATMVAAAAVGDRLVHGVAIVTEAFAGTTTDPLIQIGQTGTLGKFLEVGEGKTIDGTSLVRIPFHGVLTSNVALVATVTNGSGGAEAGKLSVSVQLLPLP